MFPDALPLVAVVIVLMSIAYFAMASIPFLFVRLDIPEVWRLFRGLLNVYFGVIGFVALMAAAAFAASGNMIFPAAMLLLSASAISMRGTVLQRIDAQQARRAVGRRNRHAAAAALPLGRHARECRDPCLGRDEPAVYSLILFWLTLMGTPSGSRTLS